MDFATQSRIDEIIAQEVLKIRGTKGKEYATEEDTLADFKEVAANAGISPLQCWLTYVEKHQRAIATFIREGAVRSESIQERALDVIVYHHLFLGLIIDLEEYGDEYRYLFGQKVSDGPADPSSEGTPMAHRGPPSEYGPDLGQHENLG